MGNALDSENEVPTIPEPFLDVVQKRSGELRKAASGGRELVVTDENGVVVKLGGHQEFDIRVERIAIADGADASGMTAYGRLRPIFTEAAEAAEAAKVDEAPVIVRPLSGGLWSIAWRVSAEGGPTITRLVNGRFFVGAQSLTTALRTLGVLTDAKAHAVAWIVDPIEGETVCARLEMKGLNVDWTIPKLGLKVSDLLLSVMFPADRDRRHLAGTIKGTIRIGSDLPFVLSNQRSLDNPNGWWLLTPQQDVTVKAAFDWVKDAFDMEPATALPPWAESLDKTLAVRRLALGIDPEDRSVSLLRVAIEWSPNKADKAGGGLGPARSGGAAFELTTVALGLAIERPFGGSRRSLTFDFNVEALILKKRFKLSGEARVRDGGSRWYLSGGCLDSLSIDDAINGLAGEIDSEAGPIFEDFKLDLEKPWITLASDGEFSFSTGVKVSPKGGGAFKTGIGDLTVEPAAIRIEGSSRGTTYSLRAGFRLENTGGPIVDFIRMSVEFSSGRAKRTVVDVSTFIRFPLRKPATLSSELQGGSQGVQLATLAGPRDEVRLHLHGTYVGGPGGGFAFKAKMEAMRLNPLIESILGDSLPPKFPQLESTDIHVSFHTGTGSFGFHGGVKVGDVGFVLHVDVGGQPGAKVTDLSAAVVGDLKLGIFLKLFGLQESAGDDRDAALSSAGFRYCSTAEGKQELEIAATWGTTGRFSFVLSKDPATDDGFRSLLLVRPGDFKWVKDGMLRWASVKRTVELFPAPKLDKLPAKPADGALVVAEGAGDGAPKVKGESVDFPRGLSFSARIPIDQTDVGRMLKAPGPLTVNFKDGDLTIEPRAWAGGDKDPKVVRKSGELAEGALDAKAKDADTDKPSRVDKPVSVSSFFELRDTDFAAFSKPKPGIRISGDVGITIDPWVSGKLSKGWVAITADRLSLTDPGLNIDLGLEGVALAFTIPKWVKGGAALLYKPSGTDGVTTVSGMGTLELVQKLNIALLVRLTWKGGSFNDAFGFLAVTGLTLGSPPFVLTGLAGGFGYNCVVEAPDQPEKVPDFLLISMLRARSNDAPPAGGEASAMLARLKDFEALVKRREGAFCIALGMSARIAEMVDCSLLALVELRNPGIEVALLGVAEFPIGPKEGKKLGFVQLGITARYSSAEGTLKVLGAITPKSWIIDEKCRLRGGFAVYVWFAGAHAGDFVISLGGYSPLVPVRPHYPALERVGFDWEYSKELTLRGDLYFALDRCGIQFGCGGQLRYMTSSLEVDASITVDALVQWTPMFFRLRIHIGVHVVARVLFTLRLDLDVDLDVWGPPFGARASVALSVGFATLRATIEIGKQLDAAPAPKAPIGEVLAMATGKQVDKAGAAPAVLTLSAAAPPPPSEGAPPPPCRADDVRLSIALAVPATRVRLEGADKDLPILDAEGKPVPLQLDVRPMALRAVDSFVSFTIEAHGRTATNPAKWRAAIDRGPALEALWFNPADEAAKWLPSSQQAVSAIHLRPPRSKQTGAVTERPTPTKAKPLPVVGAPTQGRVDGDLIKELAGAGFDLLGCALRVAAPVK